MVPVHFDVINPNCIDEVDNFTIIWLIVTGCPSSLGLYAVAAIKISVHMTLGQTSNQWVLGCVEQILQCEPSLKLYLDMIVHPSIARLRVFDAFRNAYDQGGCVYT